MPHWILDHGGGGAVFDGEFDRLGILGGGLVVGLHAILPDHVHGNVAAGWRLS